MASFNAKVSLELQQCNNQLKRAITVPLEPYTNIITVQPWTFWKRDKSISIEQFLDDFPVVILDEWNGNVTHTTILYDFPTAN